MNEEWQKYLNQIVLPKDNSHKGENGRVLVIGGSRLFHAASFWSASMASKIVDMVHFSSPAFENNELMRVRAKSKFWEGIVVPWEDVEHYINEDDAILIGPGMTRSEASQNNESRIMNYGKTEDTRTIVNTLLRKYPNKKWVVDGGALQMVDPALLKPGMIVTPNEKEREIVEGKVADGVVRLEKGQVDVVTDGKERVEIAGGNGGMTKGGTGDVLAGMVAGLYAKSPAIAAAVVASRVNKLAGENLAKKMGTFFSAGDLIPEVQVVLGSILSK